MSATFFLDLHQFIEESRRLAPPRADRRAGDAEVFTPTDLVIEMLQYLDLGLMAPERTVLDPACGDGQFLIAAKGVKVLHFKMSDEDALADLYGVDIVRENVDTCKARLGGGTILVGDALSPERRIVGQSMSEWQQLQTLIPKRLHKRPRARRAAGNLQDRDLASTQPGQTTLFDND